MENGSKKWGFDIKESLATVPAITVRRAHFALIANLDKADDRPVAPLSNGDPSFFPCFRPNSASEDAIVDALKSAKFNHYSPTVGILPARRATADYLNKDLPYQLSPDDIFLIVGCTQAIEVSLASLSRPGANILLPRPGLLLHVLSLRFATSILYPNKNGNLISKLFYLVCIFAQFSHAKSPKFITL